MRGWEPARGTFLHIVGGIRGSYLLVWSHSIDAIVELAIVSFFPLLPQIYGARVKVTEFPIGGIGIVQEEHMREKSIRSIDTPTSSHPHLEFPIHHIHPIGSRLAQPSKE